MSESLREKFDRHDLLYGKYLRSLPAWKQALFFASSAVAFASIGFFVDLFTNGRLGAGRTLLLALGIGLFQAAVGILHTYFPRYRLLSLGASTLLGMTIGAAFALLVLLRPIPMPWVWHDALGMAASVFCTQILLGSFIGYEAQKAMRIETELRLAHGIQQTLVPPVRLATARYEAYGISQPSDQVGGDLVDIVPLDDELFVYVADIAGHGLQAGILMGMLKTATRAILLAKPTLAQQMDQLNRILPQVKEPHMYAPFAGLRLRAAGTIEYGIAAHPPILHFRAREHEVVQLSQEQFPLGLLPDVDYQCLTTQVSDGDILLITTDGILEASNAGGEEFGLDRLKLLLAELAAEPAERLADAILGRVRQYGPADDDQTLLVVRAIAVGAAN